LKESIKVAFKEDKVYSKKSTTTNKQKEKEKENTENSSVPVGGSGATPSTPSIGNANNELEEFLRVLEKAQTSIYSH